MPRKKERKKTLTDLEAIVSKGRLVVGQQVFVYNRTVYQNRLVSHRNNKEQ